jgi:hypothetical protein
MNEKTEKLYNMLAELDIYAQGALDMAPQDFKPTFYHILERVNGCIDLFNESDIENSCVMESFYVE